MSAGALPPTGRLLGLDWGERRIGVALSDETRTLASPVETLTRRPGRRIPLRPIQTLITEHGVTGVVVGLPLDLDGRETPASGGARALADLVAGATGLPVVLWDESFTTAEVHAAMRAQGVRARGRREEIDRAAAATLLQRWLDAHRDGARG